MRRSISQFASAMLLLLAACSDPAPAPNAPDGQAVGQDGPAPAGFPFTTDQFSQNFDRQAAIDHTDATSGCGVSGSVFVCGFAIAEFQRAAPTEAAAAIAQIGEQMPDEAINASVEQGHLGAMNYLGSNDTPARRAHYIAQFKTLLRVLSPGLSAAGADAVIDELHLHSTPPGRENEHTSEQAYAILSCYQETSDEGGAINCAIEPPASAYPAGDRPVTSENLDRLQNGDGATWTGATASEKHFFLLAWGMNQAQAIRALGQEPDNDAIAARQQQLGACLDSRAADPQSQTVSLSDLVEQCSQ